MSPHWRLAFRYAAWVAVGAVLGAIFIWLLHGPATAGSFIYGAITGIISSLSTAVTVSLITGRSSVGGTMLGGFSFMARYVFAAVALGLPAYLGLWPAVAMCGGFAAVYLVENVVLLPLAASALSRMDTGTAAGDFGKKVERRVEI